MDNDHIKYWEKRGRRGYAYKGEWFYTITPIPYYVKRRSLLISLLENVFTNYAASENNVCDFGCGDGWYLKYLMDKYKNNKYFGVEISKSMIEQAKIRCPNAILEINENGINFNPQMDIVFSIAVFAHIFDDFRIKQLFQNIYTKLKNNGLFILFEQTAPARRSGEKWVRRASYEYIYLAEECNFTLKSHCLIAFTYHRYFEQHFAPYYYKYFSNGESYYDKMLNANSSCIFRLLSSISLLFCHNPIINDDGVIEGNSFYVFQKS